MKQGDQLFLGFAETRDDPVRGEVLRTISGSHGPMLLVRISPPIMGQQFGLGGQDVDIVVLAVRLEGYTFTPITKWPTPVYVLLPLVDVADRGVLGDTDYKLIMWGELYQTMEDAEQGSRSGHYPQ